MTEDEVLNKWIPYRLQAVETLVLAWAWLGESEQQRQVEIFVDGRLKLRGNVALIANPMIEIGIIHARALLEFLGLAIVKGELGQARRRSDDIAVENYGTDVNPITAVTPSQALEAYHGPQREAELAFMAILEWGHKGIAHVTTGKLSASYTDQHLNIACQGIRALLINNLYAKLGREIPGPPNSGSFKD